MEEQQQQLNPLAITHLLRHTLRSLCSIHENSHWVYAVFWRILPRNFPPPKWDFGGGGYDRARGNRRNWILVWEDGFCNFPASAVELAGTSLSATYRDEGGGGKPQPAKGLQAELFFKMSHEIYNYGEGLIGKVAADHSHKWLYTEPNEQEINIVTAWNSPADSHPRTWKTQFQSGIKTIALIAVREGVVQLGAVNKIMEDLSFVVYVRKKFAYLESIPGVLLPHPSASSVPIRIEGCAAQMTDSWLPAPVALETPPAPPPMELYDYFSHQTRITPSMNSLEALLSKLPSVGPAMPGQPQPLGCFEMPILMAAPAVGHRPAIDGIGGERKAKEEVEDFRVALGESSSSMAYSIHANVNKSGDEV